MEEPVDFIPQARNTSRILSKWNQKFAQSLDSEEAYRDTLNSGASFLVAPHNLRFDKQVQTATNKIRDGVKDSIQYIMGKHDKAEA